MQPNFRNNQKQRQWQPSVREAGRIRVLVKWGRIVNTVLAAPWRVRPPLRPRRWQPPVWVALGALWHWAKLTRKVLSVSRRHHLDINLGIAQSLVNACTRERVEEAAEEFIAGTVLFQGNVVDSYVPPEVLHSNSDSSHTCRKGME